MCLWVQPPGNTRSPSIAEASMQINSPLAKAQKPLVTIGIPTYNGGGTLRNAVFSALNQDYECLQVLISDNASSDNTVHTGEELMRIYPQVKYIRHQHNIGMFANFEFLLKNASGKYFMWLADDDVLLPGAVGKYVAFMETHQEFVLVSGAIEYTWNGHVTEYERGFNFYQRFSFQRVAGYYSRVIHGAMYHGLMRSEAAKQVPLQRVIGGDWHFVAGLAFLGKIRNLEFAGYRKTCGGTSRNFKQYARAIGESDFAAKHPHMKIAMDAFREVMYHSSVYTPMAKTWRFLLAVSCFIAVTTGFYLRIYPFVFAGRIKRPVKAALEKLYYAFDKKLNANRQGTDR